MCILPFAPEAQACVEAASQRGGMAATLALRQTEWKASCVDPVSYSKRFVGFMDRIST